MEFLQSIVDIISNNGIGVALIVFSGFALKYMYDDVKDSRNALLEHSESQNEKIETLVQSVNENTLAITRLIDKMDGGVNG